LARLPAGEIVLNLVKTVIRSRSTGQYLEVNG
jgi:hypothetical protein